MSSKVRVLVVDDSALMRKLIPQILAKDDSIEVVGTAMDGTFGLKKIEDLKPQVVTLDLEMPGMNGIDMLKQTMRKLYAVPVIVVSSHSTEGAAITLKALGLGAFDFVAKPSDVSTRMPEIAAELIAKIKAAANSKKVSVRPLAETAQYGKAPASSSQPPTRIVTIGVSTGGPHALQYVFSQLPADFPGTILVVQHMPENFTEMFARRLDETCALRVKEAQSGDLLMPGRALICPGSRHLKVKRLPLGNVALLSDEPRIRGHRPSADVLFRSAAEEFGRTQRGGLQRSQGREAGFDKQREFIVQAETGEAEGIHGIGSREERHAGAKHESYHLFVGIEEAAMELKFLRWPAAESKIILRLPAVAHVAVHISEPWV